MMSESKLAQKILSWVERTEQENMQDGTYGMWERRMVDRYLVLTENIEKLCKERLNALSEMSEEHLSGHFPVMCTGVGPELVHIPANSSIQFPDMDTLWQIAQVVAEKDATFEFAGFHCCNYCDGKQRIFASLLTEEELIRQLPHDPECIVTKARELMEWRKAQPRIEASIKKSDELAEDTLCEMVRQMVSEVLAKPPEPQPIEDAIVNHTCEVCGENYVGLLSNIRGWYGIVEQGTWERPEPRKEYAFCSEEHMEQWKSERGVQK
jgi:hypothetical protein